MHSASVFNSGAFRFSILLAAVFAAGSILLLAIVERSVATYALEATSGSLRNEAAVLASEDRQLGRRELLSAIDRHSHAQREQAFRYLVVDRDGRRIVGDLPLAAAKPGWADVAVGDAAVAGQPAETDVLRSLGTRLADGGLLVVATDTYDVQALRRGLDRFVIWCGIGITLFALTGGYVVGAVFLRRLERVNAAVERIMAGSLAERLPTIGLSPELDHLARNLNRMLDQIGTLMGELRQVSTDIAHDLRTPLTRLRQSLETIQGAGHADAYEAGVEQAIAQTDALLAIFRALMRIGTLESGEARKRFGPVDLSELLARVHLAYQPAAEDQGRSLRARVAPGVVVRGDGALLAQLFTNLVENALAHTPPGTHILIGLEAQDGVASAVVADDGPGVPAHERRNVFNRFYRLDRSRNTPGAGLGLAMVAAIAALHDVPVRIEDNDPGVEVVLEFQVFNAPARAPLGAALLRKDEHAHG